MESRQPFAEAVTAAPGEERGSRRMGELYRTLAAWFDDAFLYRLPYAFLIYCNEATVALNVTVAFILRR
jgi:hypothetical protein